MEKTFKILNGAQALEYSNTGRINAVYGVPGAGKTTFCISATKDNKTLFVDTERAVGKVFGGVPASQKNIKNFSSINVKTLSEAISALRSPSVNLKNYDVIAFDSATDLIEAEIQEIKKTRNLSIKDWGILSDNFKLFLSELKEQGLNVIITLHEEETPDDSGLMQHRPKTDGKAPVLALVRKADNLLFIDVNTKGERVLHTQPSPYYYAKSRDSLQEAYTGEQVCYKSISADFTKIEKTYASPEQIKELRLLTQKAKVKDLSKFYEAISWDGKGDLEEGLYARGIELLQTQIEVQKARNNKEKNVKGN